MKVALDSDGTVRYDGAISAEEHGRHMGVWDLHVGDIFQRGETVRWFQ